jgi:hypothetical protein
MLFRSWNGWPGAGQRLIDQHGSKGVGLPYGDRWCVVDYLSQMPHWSQVVVSIGSDDGVQKYLGELLGWDGVCAGPETALCEQYAKELQNVADTLDDMIAGKPKERIPPRRPGEPPPRSRPSTPAPVSRFGNETQPQQPNPTTHAFEFWYFAPTGASQCGAGIPTNYVLKLRFPEQPTDKGCNNQWVGLGFQYLGPFYDLT